MPGLEEFRGDCSSCAALCCVLPAFARSADFAVDKPAGVPCRNLLADPRSPSCGIHADLRASGFAGCTVYDCFGAGQEVTRRVLAGGAAPSDLAAVPGLTAVFGAVRQLREMLRHLTEAGSLVGADVPHAELRAMVERTTALAGSPPEVLSGLDVAAHRRGVGPLLRAASAAVRRRERAAPPDRSGADLTAARLSGADLRAADLRGACLLGADLRRARMRRADLLGTDLRGADLRGADLTGALFLTQPQVTSARGDAATTLPATVGRPPHWT